MRLASPWIPRLVEAPGRPYERLVAALAEDIAGGALPPGARLPPHRDLAYRLGIGLGTVTKAYGLLERRGLVQSVHGRGMFVADADLRPREIVDLSVNTPPQMLADRLLATTLTALAKRMDADAFGRYTAAAGSPERRRVMSKWLGDHGLAVSADRLMITNGAQHALAIAFSVACGPRGRIFTEAFTYPGAISAARHAGHTVVPVALDGEGMRPDALAAALAVHHRVGDRSAVYVTPTLQNPTAVTMSAGRREDIVRICRAHDVAIVEDDVYSLFAPPGSTTLAALAPERTYHVGGFSKTLSPGLRIGLLAVPASRIDDALAALQATSSMASPLTSAIMEQWVLDGTATSVGAMLRDEAAWRMAAATSILPELDAPTTRIGFHGWLPMTRGDAEHLARNAAAGGILVTPPALVMVDPSSVASGVRLCIGGPSRDELTRALATIRHILDNGGREGRAGAVNV